ncbi:MAG: hypothetical protein ACYSSO_03195 [Planctomycetota bacterium]|jgi:hypothetical protein
MLSSAEIKREIIKSANTSVVAKRMKKGPPSITEGEQIELGNNLEALTKTTGWAIIEEYMLARMNLVSMAVEDKLDDMRRGVAKGFIEMMQWIHLSIKTKNILIEKERLEHESKNIPEEG